MNTKIFIGICNTQDYVPSDFFWSFIGISGHYPTMVYRSRHPWDIVRNNMIISQFLKSDCDILAKMDIDQTYPKDYFERLVPLCHEYKVVGPLIYDRWEENNYFPLAFNDVNFNNFPTCLMDISQLHGVVEIPYPHTNLFYHREVIEKLVPPWYQAYFTDDGLNRLNHVDYTFIEKIHKAGYKIMIDLDCVVGHMVVKFKGK